MVVGRGEEGGASGGGEGGGVSGGGEEGGVEREVLCGRDGRFRVSHCSPHS